MDIFCETKLLPLLKSGVKRYSTDKVLSDSPIKLLYIAQVYLHITESLTFPL